MSEKFLRWMGQIETEVKAIKENITNHIHSRLESLDKRMDVLEARLWKVILLVLAAILSPWMVALVGEIVKKIR